MLLLATASALRVRLAWPARAPEGRHVQRLIDEQRAALGEEALSAWRKGFRMTAEEALRLAAEGVPAALNRPRRTT